MLLVNLCQSLPFMFVLLVSMNVGEESAEMCWNAWCVEGYKCKSESCKACDCYNQMGDIWPSSFHQRSLDLSHWSLIPSLFSFSLLFSSYLYVETGWRTNLSYSSFHPILLPLEFYFLWKLFGPWCLLSSFRYEARRENRQCCVCRVTSKLVVMSL